jgi:hypothetical protein
MSDGLPTDELFVYEDALTKGRTVVIVLANNHEEAEAARYVFEEVGAEGIDSARENWWVGLRDAEEEHYGVEGRNFAADEAIYRRGFEAALRPATRGKSYQDAVNYLMATHPDIYSEEAFRHGYRRGFDYYGGLTKKHGGVSGLDRKSTSKASQRR